MAINGGGYTFLPSSIISKLRNIDLKYLFRQRADVLLRISKPDGTQPYTVITQYVNTEGLTVQLSSNVGYAAPQNKHLGPYIYLGTAPSANVKRRTMGGFKSNNINILYKMCTSNAPNPTGFFAFFSNPSEKKMSSYYSDNDLYERVSVAVEWRK